jgi:hypothetical protein
MVARAGAGPSPIPFKELTAEGLANAILTALKPETLERAKELGERIREEKGCEAGAASFHAQLDINRLRCVISLNKTAIWRVSNPFFCFPSLILLCWDTRRTFHPLGSCSLQET